MRANGTVLHSKDAGATFLDVTAVLPPNPQEGAPSDHWRDVAVYRFATVAHAVVLTSSPTREADVTRAVYSTSKGANWKELPVNSLGPAGGLVFGNEQGQLFSANGSESTAWRGPGLSEFVITDQRWRSADDLGLVSLYDAAAGVRADGRGRRLPRDLYPRAPQRRRRRGRTGALRAAAARRRVAARWPARLRRSEPEPRERKGVRFDPERLDVQLTPGQPSRVPITAAVSPDPAPVDVTFLIDNSTSMDNAIKGVFCSIERLVRELPERNLDAHFALSHYNDFMTTTYERLVDLGPPKESGPAITEALKLLNTLRGEDEPLRGALYQLATGAGLDVKHARSDDDPVDHTDGLRGDRIVPPGQQIDWRPEGKSLRTVFVVTDEPYENGTEGEPALESVIAELTARGIRVIGLPMIPSNVKPNDFQHSVARQVILRTQIDAIARGSKALAPEGGVDCDGGGSPDVPEGGPIVCPIDESGIKERSTTRSCPCSPRWSGRTSSRSGSSRTAPTA